MPGHLERHSRSRWEWGGEPARSTELRDAVNADPDPSRRAARRKNTRDWCRGKNGVPHTPALVLVPRWGLQPDSCRWKSLWDIAAQDYTVDWYCHHREECAKCGKIIRDWGGLGDRECPAYPGSGDQRAQAEADVAAARECRAARPSTWWRRRVITGPSHYRKPKKVK